MMNNFTDEQKEQILKCAQKLQSLMFRNVDPKDSFKELIKLGYDRDIINASLALLEQAVHHNKSEDNEIARCIESSMASISYERTDEVSKDSFTTDKFYGICTDVYKNLTNTNARATPLVFLWVKGLKKLGVVPIEVEGQDVSPMDYLKTIVYHENPDAYCFCGEASMKTTQKPLKQYSYGDILNDPSSKDIVIVQGNTKKGDANYNAMYDMIFEQDGHIELKLMEDYNGENMESEKLP